MQAQNNDCNQGSPVSRDSKSPELTLMGWRGLWVIEPEFLSEAERVDVPPVPFSFCLFIFKCVFLMWEKYKL